MKKAHQGLNFIVSVILTLMVIVIVSAFGDFYFDLNDDVLMKDILSGAYTGTPAGHNIQMLYPISAFISLLYRVYRGFDWYGIFLCACQFLCVFIISSRAAQMFENKLPKFITAAALFLFMLGAIGSHFVFVQYTFTVGFMSATSAFLIATHNGDGKRDHILAVVLLIIAYLLRSEMLLLTLPVVGVAIFIKWWGDRKALFRKYVTLLTCIVLGILACQVAHRIGYSSQEWKQFNNLFDARTELYDFQYIPDYAENKEFFDSIGLSEPEQQLLVNYNYGIDDEINAETLWAVAKYASTQKTDETPFMENLKLSIVSYLYRLRHLAYQKSYEYPMTDAPYNVISLLLYIITLVMIILTKEKGKRLSGVFPIILLFACRTTLWLYIIMRGRDPIRITHPLYLMEIFVLLGMILVKAKDNKRYAYAALGITAVISAVFIPNQTAVIRDEMTERAKMRQHYDALYDYFEQNNDSFYFVDVYTSVSAMDGEERTFSEKMFDRVDNSLANHDLMGGWASKSPLYYQKLEEYGFTSMQDAILTDGVYVVAKESSGIDWLNDYYLDKGIKTDIEQVDTVADVFRIYSVSAAQ